MRTIIEQNNNHVCGNDLQVFICVKINDNFSKLWCNFVKMSLNLWHWNYYYYLSEIEIKIFWCIAFIRVYCTGCGKNDNFWHLFCKAYSCHKISLRLVQFSVLRFLLTWNILLGIKCNLYAQERFWKDFLKIKVVNLSFQKYLPFSAGSCLQERYFTKS